MTCLACGRRTMDEQWTIRDVAQHLRVAEATVRAYLARGQMPEPDGRVGWSPFWWPETIKRWRKTRRRGADE